MLSQLPSIDIRNLFFALADHAHEICYVVSQEPGGERWRFEYINRVGSEKLGLEVHDLADRYLDEVYPAEEYSKSVEHFEEVVQSNEPKTYERTTNVGFAALTWQSTVVPVRGKNGTMYIMGLTIDITEKRRNQHLLDRDPLTGLLNKRKAEMRLKTAFDHGKRPVCCFIDLDRFKEINDAYGHNVGDSVLRTVANRLMSAARTTDTVARVGGDEFLIVFEDAQEAGALPELKDRILDVFREPVRIRGRVNGGGLINVSGSVGVELATTQDHVHSLMRKADQAMYEHKTGPHEILPAPSEG